MTPKDHPVWNKMAVPTLDTLEEAIRELKEMETKEEEARSQVPPLVENQRRHNYFEQDQTNCRGSSKE